MFANWEVLTLYCLVVTKVLVTFLLPPGIKGLMNVIPAVFY